MRATLDASSLESRAGTPDGARMSNRDEDMTFRPCTPHPAWMRSASHARPAQCWIEEIITEDALAGLAPEWQTLSEQSESALLFNSHEWAQACWKHFHRSQAGRSQLWTLAVRDSVGLRAVFPLWIETKRFIGIRTRIARFLGEGPSDYGDILLAPPYEPVYDALFDHLGHAQACELLDLREFRGDSPNLAPFTRALVVRRWRMSRTDDSVCQHIPIDDGWEAYYRSRFNSKRRREHRREWRAFEEAGALEKETLSDVSEAPGIGVEFAAVQAAHVDAGEHRPGEFNDPFFRPFLEEMLMIASKRRWLRIPLLRLSGIISAYYIAFLYRGRYYVYNTAHREEYQRYGPGKLLMLYMLERFFAERGGMVDYLRGAERYKDRWTAGGVINARIRAARPGFRARLGWLIWFRFMPAMQARIPLLYRILVVASEKGPLGIARRIVLRLSRGRSEAPHRT